MEKPDKTTVCVLTAKGMAAIASVALKGNDAGTILQKIFRGKKETEGESVFHGSIVNGEILIDEVVVGAERDDTFVIHCHGNPLLVEQIVKLCQTHGAALVGAESFMSEIHQAESANTIEAEAKLAMQTCATLAGAKIIANQLTVGLLPTVRGWLDTFDDLSLQELWGKCHQVLRKTSRAQYFINRCRIVLVGPPNSGKSTLLNKLAGKDEVIVTDTAGTTRDWVKITCHVGPLLADIYDTAGLDPSIVQQDVDGMAQETTEQLVRSADMNIFIYDVTREIEAQSLLFSLGGFKGIIVANKCDLLSPRQQQNIYSKYVRMCAATGDGIDQLIQTLLAAMKVADFKDRTAVCFTDRQLQTLRQILHTKDKPTAKKHIETLLFG